MSERDIMIPSQMKVAWITPVLGVDGELLYTAPALIASAKQFKSLRVFTGEYAGNSEAFGVDIVRCSSLKLYRNERRVRRGHTHYGYGLRLASPSLIRALIRYQPDLLIIDEYSIFTFYGIVYRRFWRPQTRILITMETKPRFPEGWVVGPARTLFRRLLVKHANAILTNNVEGRQYLTEVLRVPDHLIVSEPYLVSDLSSDAVRADQGIPRTREHNGDRPIRFIYVGQLIPRKGLNYALNACARLLPRYAGRFVYQIVGDGPLRPELEELASRLNLGEHIEFLGRQAYERICEIYSQADVLLFPTLSDYRSLVPFEALSLGLPILASVHDGGISETVHYGRNGFAFDPRNTEHLVACMQQFIENPELVGEFSAVSADLAKGYTLRRSIDVLLKACHLAFVGT
jgi:glycosyltransferase involved in cell wall biosynthesis